MKPSKRNTTSAMRQVAIHREKLSHKLEKQPCVLWVPDMRGYVVAFSPIALNVSETAALAHHYTEDEVSSAAMTFREITGLRVAVRPYYQPSMH